LEARVVFDPLASALCPTSFCVDDVVPVDLRIR
jgi:hypothetical protein